MQLTTVQDLVSTFDHLHISTLKAPAPVRCRIRRYFGPLLPLPMESLSVPVIIDWVNGIRAHSETQANGCITILRSMINRAIEWGLWQGANPATRVRRKRNRQRSRYVLESEVPQLIREIEREPAMQRLYYYFVLFCGCRPGEAEGIKIVNIKNGVWFKPDTKNGSEHRIPLPFNMPDLLQRHLNAGYPEQVYVFENLTTRHPLTKVFWHREWSIVRKRAGLEDVQLRDLRRTCSTRLLNGVVTASHSRTMPLDLISVSKGVLNHRNLSTTQIYAQPMLERISGAMDANMREALAQGKAASPLHKEGHHGTNITGGFVTGGL